MKDKKEDITSTNLFVKLGLLIFIASGFIAHHGQEDNLVIAIMGVIGFIMYVHPELKTIWGKK